MKVLRNPLILLAFTLVFQGALPAWSASPGWQGGTSRERVLPNAAPVETPERFDLQCPSAYSGIKGGMLPTYWEAVDKGQPITLIKSQVQDRYFYCVYQIPSSGRNIHASVQRLIPEGYTCVSDGAGRFECRKNDARKYLRK